MLPILEVKIILMVVMAYKITKFFKEYTNILRMLLFQKLLLNFMLIGGYQEDYLMKKLVLLLDINVHL